MRSVGWRSKAAVAARALADRLETASGSEAPHPADRLEPLVRLLFPGGLDEHQRAQVAGVVGAADPFDPAVVRRVLGALDQQTAPSPMVVRFAAGDVHHVTVDVATDGTADAGDVVLVLDRADASVSVQIDRDGAYEPHVAAVLDGLLEPGDVFVDVGANVGYHSVRAAAQVGVVGRVLAVEANPENARLMLLSAAANGFEHLEVLPLALGERLGHVGFVSHIGSNGGFADDPAAALGSGTATVVPTVPLDLLGLDRVDVIKIDVEGAEPVVIAGARETLRRCRPAIVAELSCEMTERVGGVPALQHLQRVVDLGYALHLIDRSGGPPVPVGSPDDLLADWGDRGRLEDLLFLPVDRPAR